MGYLYRYSVVHTVGFWLGRGMGRLRNDVRTSAMDADPEFDIRARRNAWLILVASGFVILGFVVYTPEQNLVRGRYPQGLADTLFKTWPGLFGLALLLAILLQGPLQQVPVLFRKLAKLGAALLAFMGFAALLDWGPLWRVLRPFGLSRNEAGFWLFLAAMLIWFLGSLRILFSRRRVRAATAGTAKSTELVQQPMRSTRRRLRFADVGGLDAAKQQIRELVQSRLDPAKYSRYGVVRNGILLHGPRGSGKTFLAEATAGEFKLNYHYVSAPQLLGMWIGTTGNNIRSVFAAAVARTPVLLFFDELDSLGGGRQVSGFDGEPGGAGREYNNMVNQLMQSIDEHRDAQGLILMSATNLLDGLDAALIREGRFDLKIRVDLPDEPTREKIFEALLAKKPWRRFALREFARKTPGASAARIRALVDRAACFAAEEGRRIEECDLRRALQDSGGADRPLFQRVEWADLVIDKDIERELRTLVRLLNDADWAAEMKIPVPTGVLLVGQPGTGKTMIARLIATQARRSFYPITAADVLGSQVGASVKRLSEVFARAKEHSPSLVFFDEIDGLLPRTGGAYLGQHDIQVVEQCLIEISRLEPEHNVFLVGTTNDADRIDPRVLRGGRFSEKITIALPGLASREKLLRRHLADVSLAADAGPDGLAQRLDGFSPADLEAVCLAAKRFALHRIGEARELPPVAWADFEKAIQRVRGSD